MKFYSNYTANIEMDVAKSRIWSASSTKI